METLQQGEGKSCLCEESMKFALDTSKDLYDKKELSKFEKIGFIFEANIFNPNRFYITNGPQIEISSLEELISFIEEYEGRIVLTSYEPYNKLPVIEIYNRERE